MPWTREDCAAFIILWAADGTVPMWVSTGDRVRFYYYEQKLNSLFTFNVQLQKIEKASAEKGMENKNKDKDYNHINNVSNSGDEFLPFL